MITTVGAWHVILVVLMSGEVATVIQSKEEFTTRAICEDVIQERILPNLPEPQPEVSIKIFCFEEKR